MQEQVSMSAKKAGQTAGKAARQVKDAVENTVTDVADAASEATTDTTDLSFDGIFGGLKSMLSSFDESPFAFIKANPMRATIGGFIIGLILGAAMSKRSVTK